MSNCALVLCGGLGTRFRSISDTPKILARFGNRLFIDWLIEFIEGNGFSRTIFSTGYKSEEIKDYIDQLYPGPRFKVLCEPQPLGTGGAVAHAFDCTRLDALTVFNGDTYWSEPLPSSFVESASGRVLCLGHAVDVNDRYGTMVSYENGIRFKRGTESEPVLNSLIYSGVAKVPRGAIARSLTPPYSFETLVETAVTGANVCTYAGRVIDFGTPEGFLELVGVNNVAYNHSRP